MVSGRGHTPGFCNADSTDMSEAMAGKKGSVSMQKLAHENFLKARDYIFAHSNDIGLAWYRYHFEDGNTYTFMDALAKYQHENGGFGGLCDEFDYQGPCLKATEFAIGYIIGLEEKPPSGHPVIQNMMKYILECYHPEIGNWGDVFVPEINEGVHPRHCAYGRDLPPEWYTALPTINEDERIRIYNPNERACFAAFVALYPELVPDELYRDIIKYPSEKLMRYYDKNSPDFDQAIVGSPYDLYYYQWFVACLKDKLLADKLTAILSQNPTACMELDYAKSDSDYVELPCDVVTSPDSVIYPAVKDLVDDSLQYLIKRQSDDGRWPLTWLYDDEKLRELQKANEVNDTINMLVKLKRFGRIELCDKELNNES